MALFNRKTAAPPAEPLPLPFVLPHKQPKIIAACEKLRIADANLAEKDAEAASARASAAELLERAAAGHAVSPEDIEAAETRAGTLEKDRKWADFARKSAAKGLADANTEAWVETYRAGFQWLGAKQDRMVDRACELLNEAVGLDRAIVALERAGLDLRPGGQVWPAIDRDMIERFRRNAKWLQFAPDAPPPEPDRGVLDPDNYTHVKVLRMANSGPTRNVAVNEMCWVHKDEVRGLIAQYPPAIAFIGQPPDEFRHVPSTPPTPDDLGQIRVRFVADHWVGGVVAFGSARSQPVELYREGQVIEVGAATAWAAIVAGDAVIADAVVADADAVPTR